MFRGVVLLFGVHHAHGHGRGILCLLEAILCLVWAELQLRCGLVPLISAVPDGRSSAVAVLVDLALY